MSAAAARPPLPRTKFQAWKLAARPPTLWASVGPVILGTAVAIREDEFAWLAAVAALIAAVALQIGANLANDYADFERGADTATRLGPPRATQLGLLTAGEVKRGMALVFLVATLAGLYLVFAGGWLVLVVGLVSIAAAIGYTAGPWPYGYHALGDAGTFVFFGLAGVVGTYYVQAGEFAAAAWWWAFPIGFLVTAILVVNNLRDIPTDRVAGKHTLAVMTGERVTRAWYTLLVVVAFVMAIAAWPLGYAGPLVLLSLGAGVLALPSLRAILGGTSGGALNPHLKATAKLGIVFAVLAVPGIVV